MRDLKHLLKSLGVSEAIVSLEDQYNLSAEEILKIKAKLHQLMADHTGQKLKEIEKRMERDYFMNAAEAKEFGIIDEVVDKRIPVEDN